MIGILLALQVNNWNNTSIQKEKEIILLKEMKSNLNDDLKDLYYNIKNNKDRINFNEVLIKVIEQRIPYHDSLKPYFGNFFGNFQLVENTSAWENLKSIGLDVISNDSLRNKLSFLYSTKYKYLENLEVGFDDKFHWDFLYPQLLEHISLDELWVTGKPRSYEKWLKDEKFYEVLKLNLKIRNYMQNQYETNFQLVLALEKDIDKHLESLTE